MLYYFNICTATCSRAPNEETIFSHYKLLLTNIKEFPQTICLQTICLQTICLQTHYIARLFVVTTVTKQFNQALFQTQYCFGWIEACKHLIYWQSRI